MADLTNTAWRFPAWTFAVRLRQVREDAGLTQSELAAVSLVGERSIARYEAGEGTPRPLQLRSLATALGTTVEWLLTGNGPGVGAEQGIPPSRWKRSA